MTNQSDEAMNAVLPIAPLTKVTLELEAIPAVQEKTEPPGRFNFSFVCGLGIEGLTAFEKELQGLAPGDRKRLDIVPLPAAPYFEHLTNPFLGATPVSPPFELSIRVVSVDPVSDRELVRALAEKTEAGGGDCGCGCGGGCGEI